MNLKKLFNYNYFKQNLKKSKSMLAFFIGIIPIFYVFMIILISKDSVFIPSLEELSIINYAALYILPIVLSVCLFGYVFKKKSVDFINSMPISRKTIFTTNTIGGIILILLLNLINIVLMFILSLIIPTVVIPFSMLIDYFLIWTIIYTFVFVISNISISLVGNMITSIALTLLIMFLIPFIDTYILLKQTEIVPIIGSLTYLQPVHELTYTAPYNFLVNSFTGEDTNLFSNVMLIKMFILIIIYILIGYFSFLKRKMEVCETSFKNNYIHNFVKSLTLIPFTILFYELSKEADIIVVIIILALMFAYYLIYDLITKRSITNLLLNIIFFIGTVILSYTILLVSNELLTINTTKISKELKESNIKDVEILTNGYENFYRTNIEKSIIIKDNKMISKLVNTNYINCNNNKEMIINFKNGLRYKADICLDTNKEIENALNNELRNINFSNIYGLVLDEELLDLSNIKYIKNSISNINKNPETFVYDTIEGYTYKDRKLTRYYFNPDMSKETKKIYVNAHNNKVLKDIDNFEIYSASLDNNYLNYIKLNEIKNFIKKDKIIDTTLEYNKIYLSTNKGEYKYYTNNKEELKKIFVEEEYNNYTNDTKELRSKFND